MAELLCESPVVESEAGTGKNKREGEVEEGQSTSSEQEVVGRAEGGEHTALVISDVSVRPLLCLCLPSLEWISGVSLGMQRFTEQLMQYRVEATLIRSGAQKVKGTRRI